MDGDTGRLSFELPELSVAAKFRNRQPWSEERLNCAGPEGWLGRTGLLPLHYFVVSKTQFRSLYDSVAGAAYGKLYCRSLGLGVQYIWLRSILFLLQ